MKDVDRTDRLLGIVVISIIVVAGLIFAFRLWQKKGEDTPIETEVKKVENNVKIAGPRTVIDYNKLGKDDETDAMMKKRKKELGVNKGIDIIVKSDESLKIGKATVPMQDVLDKIDRKEGEIIEKDLDKRGKETTLKKDEIYGIHVVKPGDNIWNIHFTFLKDYFENKGIQLSPLSDEPSHQGTSSGVGKLLKFSETMVYIYNIRRRKIDVNLDLIHPLNKIVVFKMKQIFTLLDQINYTQINRVQFDGETLWLPAQQ